MVWGSKKVFTFYFVKWGVFFFFLLLLCFYFIKKAHVTLIVIITPKTGKPDLYKLTQGACDFGLQYAKTHTVNIDQKES